MMWCVGDYVGSSLIPDGAWEEGNIPRILCLRAASASNPRIRAHNLISDIRNAENEM